MFDCFIFRNANYFFMALSEIIIEEEPDRGIMHGGSEHGNKVLGCYLVGQLCF